MTKYRIIKQPGTSVYKVEVFDESWKALYIPVFLAKRKTIKIEFRTESEATYFLETYLNAKKYPKAIIYVGISTARGIELIYKVKGSDKVFLDLRRAIKEIEFVQTCYYKEYEIE